ncbi:hypothetical protein Ppa06_48890 [Planomonospora parontospora subsp. parontospora]|uniref:Regulatory protein n=2 Tax=Planomonospora parontospora TaxID=58119 RepID=A0AA37BN65_9ACTN|nr:DUF5685 family protein [Planomonospora parontospora]GGK94628.1 hypothetical protein GCM10010126_62540 [Planomonospora parontospora]GII11091.1 hypothetical protein Ppa06_48890 [Planomonospora parontospora subsp. parontospora]
MFGIIRPCGEHTCPSLRRAWAAHLCGLCLTLRDGQGQTARLAANYDGLIVSVLTEAQLPSASPHRKAGPCPLRGFRSADVVDARAQGARLAASVSLVLAAGRIRDHVADGDSTPATAPVRGLVAARWASAGARMGAGIGFDTAVLDAAVERQLALERRAAVPARTPGVTLLDLTGPAEEAVAAAFAHTAVLAGRPGNAEALAEAGRFFGRIAHLLDAVEDREEDDARGAFNPLTATGTSREEARRLCDDAARGLALALREVELEDRHLAEVLLGTEVRRAVERAFGASASSASYERPGFVRRSAAGVATFLTCGMWRPRWSRKRGRPGDERCYLRECDCSGGCCDCCCCDCSP